MRNVKVEYSKNQGFHLNFGNGLPNPDWTELTGYIKLDKAHDVINHLREEIKKIPEMSIEEMKDSAIEFLFY